MFCMYILTGNDALQLCRVCAALAQCSCCHVRAGYTDTVTSTQSHISTRNLESRCRAELHGYYTTLSHEHDLRLFSLSATSKNGLCRDPSSCGATQDHSISSYLPNGNQTLHLRRCKCTALPQLLPRQRRLSGNCYAHHRRCRAPVLIPQRHRSAAAQHPYRRQLRGNR